LAGGDAADGEQLTEFDRGASGPLPDTDLRMEEGRVDNRCSGRRNYPILLDDRQAVAVTATDSHMQHAVWDVTTTKQ